MGILVDKKKCTGCGTCESICPGDLMAVDPMTKKSYIRDQKDCWDCMSCVKYCPNNALATKLPYQLADYKATLIPKVLEDKIIWTLTDKKGRKETFEIKTLEV